MDQQELVDQSHCPSHIVHKFERLRAQQREAEHLFQSLLLGAFRGELGVPS